MTYASERLKDLPGGIFQDLNRERRRLERSGASILDLSVGSPDMPPPREVMETLAKSALNPSNYRYAMASTEHFLEALAGFYERRYGVHLNLHTEIVQLPGSQDGLGHLAMSLINEGDLVLVPDPGYPIYEASVRIAGGSLYCLKVTEASGFMPNFDQVPLHIWERTKLVVLNSPANPTAGVADKSFFEKLVQLAKKHQFIIAHDFAYSELYFTSTPPLSLLSIPGAKDVAVEFNSFSKTFNMAGCRIGYLVGNANILEPLVRLKSHMDYGIFLPIQEAATKALETPDDILQAQRDAYKIRRDLFCGTLQAAGWDVAKPKATMFVWAKIPATMDSMSFTMNLLRHAGVIVTPGVSFGLAGEGYVRMALVHHEAVLIEAATRIANYLAAAPTH